MALPFDSFGEGKRERTGNERRPDLVLQLGGKKGAPRAIAIARRKGGRKAGQGIHQPPDAP